MRRPPLFALMLGAFVTVILLGSCGAGTVFFLSTRVVGNTGSPTPPWVQGPGTPAPMPPMEIPDEPSFGRRGGPAPGALVAMLAFTAVLIGGATFFSRRVTRPLTQLTRAARTMAEGDLTVRVKDARVREIHELANAFNSMAASLSDADRQRRQMTADVAHELRTPLSIIRGRLEGMQDGIYTATQEQISTLLDETALLERLIEDLRVLALADAGQLPLYPEAIMPRALLESVVQSFAPQGREHGVDVRVALLPELPDVTVDSQRILQVLGNLTANSLRHTPPGGLVTLGGRTEMSNGRQMVVLSVSDTGSGIAPEDLAHIFDRFYRADQSRTRASGGAGLGLAIAKRMIEAHGGDIRAYSERGRGTTMEFSLPVG